MPFIVMISNNDRKQHNGITVYGIAEWGGVTGSPGILGIIHALESENKFGFRMVNKQLGQQKNSVAIA